MTRLPIQADSVRKWGMYNIVCEDLNDRSWKLNFRFRCDDPRIRKMLQRIETEGTIDPTRWTRSPRGL